MKPAIAWLIRAGMPAALAVSCPFAAVAQEWPVYVGSANADRYSSAAIIDRTNVDKLEVLWTRPGIDAALKNKYPDLTSSNYLKGTPIMIGGVLYAPNGVGLVEAFDAKTGKTRWVQQPFAATLQEAAGESTRGVAYWRRGSDRRIIVSRGNYLYALDAATGKLVSGFGERGRVLLKRKNLDGSAYFGLNGPIVVNDVIVVAGNGGGGLGGDSGDMREGVPEDVRGFDAVTGRLLWTFHVMPREGEAARASWGKGSAAFVGHMGAWAPLSADAALGHVYVPLTAPTNAYYGGHRPGDNLYSNSLVALDTRTGKLVWHFQTVHHDLWDYDNGAPPTLANIVVDGKPIEAVVQTSKTGFIFVLDRRTGKPVWPVEERAVPQSDVPGEVTSPTQPFPTKPPPVGLQGVSENDLIDFTPELNARALAIANEYRLGDLFTPPSLRQNGKRGTLAVPGAWGAATWNSGAYDPETARYYAVVATQVTPYGLAKTRSPSATMAYAIPEEAMSDGNYDKLYGTGPSGLPLLKPPYGAIVAYDLNKGDKLWTVANGEGPRNHPLLKHLNLPALGIPGRPAPLVTKTLLFLGESSDAVFGGAGQAGPSTFRAYDKENGKVLAQVKLPAGTTGGPVTYVVDGRQFVVVPVGDDRYGSGWVAIGLRR